VQIGSASAVWLGPTVTTLRLAGAVGLTVGVGAGVADGDGVLGEALVQAVASSRTARARRTARR